MQQIISIKKERHHPTNLWLLGFIYSLITFSFGTTNSLLVLYLTEKLHFNSTTAYELFAAFNALIFVLPIVGGFLADRFGHKEATIIGIFFCAFALFIPSGHSQLLLSLELAMFAIGLAVCATTSYCMVDFSYSKEDPLRESGFTMFYLLFNVGFLISSFAGGFIADRFGYHTAFCIAGVSASISLVTFIAIMPFIKAYKGRSLDGSLDMGFLQKFFILAVILIIFTLGCMLLLEHLKLTSILLFALVIFIVFNLIYMARQQETKAAKVKLYAFLLLCILSIGFWALYMLEPSLLTIFIAKNVDRNFFGHIIPPSTFYGLDPFYIILLGLFFSWFWRFLAKRNKAPSIPCKFAVALLVMGLGYFIFIIGIMFASKTHMVNLIWVFIGYLFLSTAEILLSPTGLAMVGRLSPKGKEGLLMGTWQLFTGFSAIISGYLADLTVSPVATTPVVTNPIYAKSLFFIGLIAIVCAVITGFFVPMLNKLVAGNHS